MATAAATAIVLRPLLPIDETRYMTVAWEMWSDGSLLVPQLNGAPYAHKPPLLFWLIQLVWSLTGVSETAARLIPCAFAVATLAVTGWIARRLWPDDARARFFAPLMLVGMPVFLTFGTLVMFDVVLTFFTALATAAVVALAQGARGRWWVLYAACFGAAILTKGPVAALFLLPAPLLAPLWWPEDRAPRPRQWYGRLGLAAAGGVAIALAWAVPAAIAGGEAYADRLLLRQTVERVAGALGHPRPWWFYIAVMPVLLYPWGWMPSAWRSLAAETWADRRLRFCLCAALPSVLALSAVHGKQLHYLIPALPFAALMFAHALSGGRKDRRRADTLLPLALPVLVGLCLLASPLIVAWRLQTVGQPSPVWLHSLSPLWGIALLAAAIVPVAIASMLRRPAAEGLAAATLGIFAVVHVAGNATIFTLYDLRPVAGYLRAHPELPVAFNRTYNGEFGFLGRLKRPVQYVDDAHMQAWIASHRSGLVIYRYKAPPPFLTQRPAIEHPYYGHRIGIWQTAPAEERIEAGRS